MLRKSRYDQFCRISVRALLSPSRPASASDSTRQSPLILRPTSIYFLSADCHSLAPRRLKPGVFAILAIRLAEFFLQHLALFADPQPLHGNHNQENKEQLRPPEIHNQSGEKHSAEHVNWILNSRIQSVSHQLFCLRLNRKRPSQLKSRQRPQSKSHNRNRDSHDLMRSPRRAAVLVKHKEPNRTCGNDPYPRLPRLHPRSLLIFALLSYRRWLALRTPARGPKKLETQGDHRMLLCRNNTSA